LPIYDEVHQVLIEESAKRQVKLLAHNPKQLVNRSSMDSVISKYIYCYISPIYFFKDDFLWKEESYNEYAKRTGISKQIMKDIVSSKNKVSEDKNLRLNYEIN
jgi:hypothetical protein